MVVRLSCILMHTGVSFSWVIWQSFFERYTRVLMETSPEFLIHFLKIYSFSSFTIASIFATCTPSAFLTKKASVSDFH
jgi:hypothetical protein